MLGLLVLVVIFIIYVCWKSEDSLYGYWVAPEDFCDRAGVGNIMLFLDEGAWSFPMSVTRRGYLIIDDVYSGLVTFTYTYSLTLGTVRRACAVEWISGDPAPWSDDVRLECYEGSLRIFDGERLAAQLYKQNEVTSLVGRW